MPTHTVQKRRGTKKQEEVQSFQIGKEEAEEHYQWCRSQHINLGAERKIGKSHAPYNTTNRYTKPSQDKRLGVKLDASNIGEDIVQSFGLKMRENHTVSPLVWR
jgi:hypothetical protein